MINFRPLPNQSNESLKAIRAATHEKLRRELESERNKTPDTENTPERGWWTKY